MGNLSFAQKYWGGSTEDAESYINRRLDKAGGVYRVKLTNESLEVLYNGAFLCNFLPIPVSEDRLMDLASDNRYSLNVEIWSSTGLETEIKIDPTEASSSGYFDRLFGFSSLLYYALNKDRCVYDLIRILSTEKLPVNIDYSFCGKNPFGGQFIFRNGDVLEIGQRDKAPKELGSELRFVLDDMTRVTKTPRALIMLIYALLSVLYSTLRCASLPCPDFALAIIGKSGTRKTTCAVLFFDFHKHSEPALSFRDSPSSIRRVMQGVRDCVLHIDDGRPPVTNTDAKILEEKFDLTCRAVGDANSGGKIVIGGKATDSQTFFLPVITAEYDVSNIESTNARVFKIPFSHDDVDLATLTYAQKNINLYDDFLDSYISWAFTKLDIHLVGQYFEANRQKYLAQKRAVHGRQINAVAWLETGFALLRDYVDDAKLYHKERLEELRGDIMTYLDQYLNSVEDSTGPKGQLNHISEALQLLVHENIVTLRPLRNVDTTNLASKDGNIVGFFDNHSVHLLTQVLCDEINKSRDDRSGLISAKYIRQVLFENGFVDQGKHDAKHLTRAMSINRQRLYVTTLYRTKIQEIIGEDAFL